MDCFTSLFMQTSKISNVNKDENVHRYAVIREKLMIIMLSLSRKVHNSSSLNHSVEIELVKGFLPGTAPVWIIV